MQLSKALLNEHNFPVSVKAPWWLTRYAAAHMRQIQEIKIKTCFKIERIVVYNKRRSV